MKNDFYAFVERQVQKALPSSWKKVPPGKGPCQIRHAFYADPMYGKSKLINVLVLPLSLELEEYLEDQLIKLRDRILSKGHLLLVISEEEHAGILADMGVFIEEHLFVNSPDFLWITCSRDQDYKTRIDSEVFEDLHTVIHDLWKGVLCYHGPKAGLQRVNLEMIQDECPRCLQPMTTITGLVFPDIQLSRWDNADWFYYNQLLSLSELNGDNALSIQQFVTLLRKVDPAITPIRKRYDRVEQTSYIAAICPHCKARRGDFEIADYRTQYLFSLESRTTGHLKYFSISLNIDQNLIDSLTHGFEFCDHTCINGWTRKYPPPTIHR